MILQFWRPANNNDLQVTSNIWVSGSAFEGEVVIITVTLLFMIGSVVSGVGGGGGV